MNLGDITAARSMEMMIPFWMRLLQGVIGHPHFNYRLVIGNRDLEAGAVHGQGNLGPKLRDEVVADVLAAIQERRA